MIPQEVAENSLEGKISVKKTWAENNGQTTSITQYLNRKGLAWSHNLNCNYWDQSPWSISISSPLSPSPSMSCSATSSSLLESSRSSWANSNLATAIFPSKAFKSAWFLRRTRLTLRCLIRSANECQPLPMDSTSDDMHVPTIASATVSCAFIFPRYSRIWRFCSAQMCNLKFESDRPIALT